MTQSALAEPAVPPAAHTPDDLLAGVLTLAFGLEARSRVLVGGGSLEPLMQALRRRSVAHVDGLDDARGPKSGQYDVIVLNGGNDMREVPRMLACTDRLAEQGCVVLTGRNRYALLDLRRFNVMAGRRRWTLSRFKQTLRSHGLAWIESFYCQLSQGLPGEVFTEQLKHLELPAHYPPSFRLASAAGVYPLLAESYVVMASRTPVNRFTAFRGRLAAQTPSSPEQAPTIVRAMLRSRGTFVVETRTPATSHETIVRIGLEQAVEQNLNANHQWAGHVRQSLHEHGDEASAGAVPQSEGTARFGTAIAYREEKRRGVLGWQLPVGATRQRLDRDVATFLISLARATHRPVTLDDDVVRQWLDDDVVTLAPLFQRAPELRDTVREMVQQLSAANRGRTISLVVSHGDFGLGNLLADPQTGALEGVIDWDCARHDAPLWLDWANMLVQREPAPTVSLAFAAINERVLRDSEWLPAGAADVKLHVCDARTLLTVLAIRFVARDCRFRGELDATWMDFRDILNQASRLWSRA